MRFKSTKIKFDGQTPKQALGDSSYNGDIWFATTENSMYKEEFAGQPEIIETSVPGRDQPYFHRVDHAPLEFNMVLAFEDSITEKQLKQLYLWLYKPDYRELKFGADYEGDTFQEKSFYVIFNNQPKITYVFDEEENIKGYIKLHARCNSSTGFIKEIHDIEKDESITINNEDGVEPILYEINVKSIEAGDIKIGYEDILIEDASKEEEITINNNTKVITTNTKNKNIYKDWNKKWISVRPGEEKEISTSNITGTIITYKPVFM